MSVHKHVLDPVQHAAFLARGLVDPFSGVPFRPPSAIVFCASCGTPFLSDTWDAIGGRHCEQSDTMAIIPDAASVVPPMPADPPQFPPPSTPAPYVRPAAPAPEPPKTAPTQPSETRDRKVDRVSYAAPMLLTLPEQPSGVAYRNRRGALNADEGEVSEPRSHVVDSVSRPPADSASMPLHGPHAAMQTAARATPGRSGLVIALALVCCLALAWFAWRWWNGPPAEQSPNASDAPPAEVANPVKAVDYGLHSGHITGADAMDADGRPFERFEFASNGDGFTVRLRALFIPRLSVETPDGQQLVAVADSAGGEAVIAVPADNGTYFITVAPAAAADRGAFELQIEPANGKVPIELDEEVNGTLTGAAGAGRVRKSYVVQAERGTVYSIALDAGFVPGVEIEGPAGPLLMRGGLGGQVVQFVPQKSGAHVLEISAEDGKPAGVFRFMVSAGGGTALGPRKPAENSEEIQDAPEVVENQSAGPSQAADSPTRPSRPSAPVSTTAPRRNQPSAAPARRPASTTPARPQAAPAQRPGQRRSGRSAPVMGEVRGFSRNPISAPTPFSHGFEGVGMYRVVVSGPGEVIDVRVERPSGSPVADAEALRTLRTWSFEPGQRVEVGAVVFEFRAR